jgi:predicted DNA-binding antitoxin AbrB/MazE fold protein
MVFHPSKLEHQKSDDKEDMETLEEGLRTEIKVRSKKQQFQEATKMVNKKLKEINSILEFAQGLKTDLQEVECDSCSRMMENMKHNIAEAYKKMKTL